MQEYKPLFFKFIFAFFTLFILLHPSYSKEICSYDGNDISEHGIMLVFFHVYSTENPTEGNEVRVEFLLRNVGETDLNLSSKGVFGKIIKPNGKKVSYGTVRENGVLKKPIFLFSTNEVIYDDVLVNFTYKLSKGGEWEIFPSYQIVVNGVKENGPYKWNSCVFKVEYKDSDDDGVPDNTDNCPNNYNPDQKDSDDDGIGDVCDNRDDGDDDKDGIINDYDNCKEVYNPLQEDYNNNGIGDACEEQNLMLEQVILDPEQGKILFRASAENAEDVERIILWINNEKKKECNSSPCEYTSFYPKGVFIFTASGEDKEGRRIHPGNLFVEGVSYDVSKRIPSSTCSGCPEIEGLGDCVEETCEGSSLSSLDPYVKETSMVGCVYENQGVSTPMVFFEVEGSESSGTVFSDVCSPTNSSELIEFYCSDNMLKNRSYECRNGCFEGKCICVDSDNGTNYGVKGDVEGREDVCVSPTRLKEYYCGEEGIEYEYVDCYSCYDGVCVCHETDSANDYFNKGFINIPYNLQDTCLDSNRLREYSCLHNIPTSEEFFCPSGCSEGKCICSDTDGGIEPYVFGSAGEGKEDECIGNVTLKEWYKVGEGNFCTARFVFIDCMNGCSNGKCRATCYDGIQNQDEEGIDCGGSCPASCVDCLNEICGVEDGEYNCHGVANRGNGKESNLFLADNVVVQYTASLALMEYANCLKDENCRERLILPNSVGDYINARKRYEKCLQQFDNVNGNYDMLSTECKIILKDNIDENYYYYDYSDIDVRILDDDPNAIMEAVDYYVDKHMTYMLDEEEGRDACNIENSRKAQSAVYTILLSRFREGKLRNLYLFSADPFYSRSFEQGIIHYGLKHMFEQANHSLSENATLRKIKDTEWEIIDNERFLVVMNMSGNNTTGMSIFLTYTLNCPSEYCGDSEDFAILRGALMYALGIASDCAYVADHYYDHGKSESFNLVLYKNKWRIMDSGVLGRWFKSGEEEHVPDNVWNNEVGTFYCPDWVDDLGDGENDCGCEKEGPPKNYVGGFECPSDSIGDRPEELQTYMSDICP